MNFETNFFTEERTLDRTVRLLGQRVDLRIWAHSYTWHFGDGEAITTSKPGAPYPKLLITHNYLKKGAYRPAMDTTWVADYRVGGGAWQSVPGSVTIEGSPTNLQAIEARPTLVGYRSRSSRRLASARPPRPTKRKREGRTRGLGSALRLPLRARAMGPVVRGGRGRGRCIQLCGGLDTPSPSGSGYSTNEWRLGLLDQRMAARATRPTIGGSVSLDKAAN